jgi:hypothetical protein
VRLATSLAGKTVTQAPTRVVSATAKLPAVPRRDEVNVLVRSLSVDLQLFLGCDF